MIAEISPSKAEGRVFAPPSKSMAHRLIIAAALSEKSEISNVAFSDDINATVGCLKGLGAAISKKEDKVTAGGLLRGEKQREIYCNESGSTLRFLIPLCLLSEGEITLRGTKRLFERPLGVYEEIFKSQGITYTKGEGFLTLCGKLKSGEYRVRGDISSQFITGLLYALPLLCSDSKIIIEGRLESRPYIDLTLSALSLFGIVVTEESDGFFVKGNQRYKSLSAGVEGDYSNAAFLEGFNLIGGDVEVLGLDDNSLQGDRVYKEIYSQLKSGNKQFDISDCPDLAPVLFTLSAIFGGAVFNGTKRLKIKESDRGEVMKRELSKFGIELIINENSVEVVKGEIHPPKEILLSHNDHRVVMSLALLCSLYGGKIDGCEAVNKSFPDFFEKIKSLGIEVKLNDT
jgi:3-phosphoshikimate 1-carboxyvinyltransferase